MSNVNGIQVGRSENSRLIPIDVDKLKQELDRRRLSKAEASRQLIRSKSYFNNIIYQRGVTKSASEQIERVLGIPPEAYLLKPREEQKPESNPDQEKVVTPVDLERVEYQLARIADALEILASVPAVSVTRVERCTLLLKQMLVYGTCLFNDFEKRAEAYGFTAEEIKEAVRLAGASKELKNGKDMYLRRNK